VVVNCCLYLSRLQRLLLVNTSKGKKGRGAGALERENESVGNNGKREKVGASAS